MSKNLLEGYTEVLKMWPSRPEGRVKFQENDKQPRFRRQKKDNRNGRLLAILREAEEGSRYFGERQP
jgi:hypothetical protein